MLHLITDCIVPEGLIAGFGKTSQLKYFYAPFHCRVMGIIFVYILMEILILISLYMKTPYGGFSQNQTILPKGIVFQEAAS